MQNYYRQVQNDAMEILLDYDIVDIPINVDLLLERMKIMTVPYRTFNGRKYELLMKCSEDGFSHIDESLNSFIIYYNDDKVYYRVKFTKGHEIRHITMCHGSDDYDNETDANYFARYLLVPIPIIKELGIKNVYEVEYIFDVSEKVATYALEYYYRYRTDYIEYTDIEKEFVSKYNHVIRKSRLKLDILNRKFQDIIMGKDGE